MRAGTLRHSVEVQQATEAVDDRHGIRKVWTTLAERRAQVTELGGTETVKADQLVANATHEVRLRWFDGLSPAHRLIHNGRHLNIEAVSNPDGRKREQLCACIEDINASAQMEQLVDGKLVLYPIQGRPATTSVLLRCVSPVEVEAYYRWGTTAANLALGSTTPTVYAPFTSIDAEITGLTKYTVYYYRFAYRRPGEAEYTEVTGTIRTGRTTGVGGTFSFDIWADGHQWGDYYDASHARREVHAQMLANVAAGSGDGAVVLGDTFQGEHYAGHNSPCRRDALRRHMHVAGLWGSAFVSKWLCFVLGNHEGEQLWRKNAGQSLPGYARDARKTVIPNPTAAVVSDLGGDLGTDGENCYSWVWGNATLIVLDPFAFTGTQPHNKDDIEGSGDNWDWTLDSAQYLWLASTLLGSSSTWKFVFLHHLVGGVNNYGRGGIECVKHSVAGKASYEMGGEDGDGNDVWSTYRPGVAWSLGPLHDLFVQTGVNVAFHGHDHCGVRQLLDDVVYHTIGKPSDSTYGEGFYGSGEYADENGTKVLNSHHLRVTVGNTNCTVESIAAVRSGDPTPGHGYDNGEVMDTYVIT